MHLQEALVGALELVLLLHDELVLRSEAFELLLQELLFIEEAVVLLDALFLLLDHGGEALACAVAQLLDFNFELIVQVLLLFRELLVDPLLEFLLDGHELVLHLGDLVADLVVLLDQLLIPALSLLDQTLDVPVGVAVQQPLLGEVIVKLVVNLLDDLLRVSNFLSILFKHIF